MGDTFQNMFLASVVLVIQLFLLVSGDDTEVCSDDSRCTSPLYCCTDGEGCCTSSNTYYYSTWSIWNMWYFWFIIIFILLSCFGGCGYWRRRQWAISQQRRQTVAVGGVSAQGAAPPLSTPAMYAYDFGPQQVYVPPPQPGQAATFQSPPAYTEVVSKPDMYPPNKTDCPPYPGFNVADPANQNQYATNPVGPPAYTMTPPASEPTDTQTAAHSQQTAAAQP